MRRNERGQALVEAALVIPFLILLALGSMDLLRAETAKSNVNFLATQGAACAVKANCVVAANISANATGLSMNQAQLSFTQPAPNAVTVSYTFTPAGPFFPSITMQSTATAN